MPLACTDLVEGRTEKQVRAVAGAVHAAIVEVLGIPERDRFQAITEHPRGRIIARTPVSDSVAPSTSSGTSLSRPHDERGG